MVAAPVNGTRVIGVDLGGTKILGGVLDERGSVLDRHEVQTPTGSQDALLSAIDDVVSHLFADGIAALAVGVPSRIDTRTGRVLASVNIPLAEVDLRDRLRERFRRPVDVGNDANVATLGEWRAGAGRGTRDMVMLTLGTGVGGGVVVDGRLYPGWAELGHIVVQAGGERCQGTCTGHGHLEVVASGTAADRAAQELWGGDADAEDLVERAKEGDAGAVEALAAIGRLLGAGIGSLVNVFNPEIVVIGGGFGVGSGDLLLGPALDVARVEALAPAGERLRLVEAELGSDAGLIGAGFLALEALDRLAR